MIAYFALKHGIVEGSEQKYLYFECIGCAILVPLIAFLLRILFVTPHKISRDAFQKKERAKPAEANVLPPKESHIIGILCCICALLILSLIIQSIPNSSETNEPPRKESAAVVETNRQELKPLPDKIIPKPESTTITAAGPAAESQKQFVIDIQDTNDAESALAQLKVENKNQTQAAENEALSDWTNNLSAYNYALKCLYDIMKAEATRRNDSVTLTEDYFNSLPQIVAHSGEETKIAEIRFTNQTNLDFRIMITGENREGYNYIQPRALKITCDCGSLQFVSFHGISHNLFLKIPDIQFTPGPGFEHESIKKEIKLLVAAQIEYLRKIPH